MIKDLLGALLEELGHSLKIPDLHPDRNHTCLIALPEGIKVQIELDQRSENIIMGADLGLLPVGRYRMSLFREALKANGLSHPLHGVLAYSNKTEHLILFEMLRTKDLTGEKIATSLGPFVEKALRWKNAVEKGEIPSVATFRTSSGMFGLRP